MEIIISTWKICGRDAWARNQEIQVLLPVQPLTSYVTKDVTPQISDFSVLCWKMKSWSLAALLQYQHSCALLSSLLCFHHLILSQTPQSIMDRYSLRKELRYSPASPHFSASHPSFPTNKPNKPKACRSGEVTKHLESNKRAGFSYNSQWIHIYSTTIMTQHLGIYTRVQIWLNPASKVILYMFLAIYVAIRTGCSNK